jgi:acetylaranotin biosynthesis cluster protein L
VTVSTTERRPSPKGFDFPAKRLKVPLNSINAIANASTMEKFFECFARTDGGRCRCGREPDFSGSTVGFVNTSTGYLHLRFAFSLERSDRKPGSPEEKEFAAGYAQGFLVSVQKTIDTIRELVRAG